MRRIILLDRFVGLMEMSGQSPKTCLLYDQKNEILTSADSTQMLNRQGSGRGRSGRRKLILWTIVLAGYFPVGLAFVFVGPTARLRWFEQEKFELADANAHPRWKLVAFSCATALAIVILWPILIVSAARAEAASKVDFNLFDSRSVEPSAELDRWISEIRDRYSNSLSFKEYKEILAKLSWTDHHHFDSRLTKLGYAVTGFATDAEGQDIAVAVPVLSIGMPIGLTRFRGKAASLPAPRRLSENEISLDPLDQNLSFKLQPKPNDELWEFSSSRDTWEHLAGCAGLALVRERTVIDAYITMGN